MGEQRGSSLNSEALKAIQLQAKSPLYGPFLAANLEAFMSEPGDTSPELIMMATGILTYTFNRSTNNYIQNASRSRAADFSLDQDFLPEIEKLQKSVTSDSDDIHQIAPKFAMSVAEGAAQVIMANKLFSDQRYAGTQQELARRNYGLFWGEKILASAAAIQQTPLAEIVSELSPERMPHLMRTNYAIANMVVDLSMRHDGPVHIRDQGSGFGATLAAITKELADHASAVNLDNLSMVGIETTPPYVAALQQFGHHAVSKLAEAGGRFRFTTEANPAATSETGTVSMIDGDILETVMQLPQSGSEALDVWTANYVWHRLPDIIKARLIRRAAQSENVVMLVGDLAQNASQVNRHHYNFTNNGPLNCGNIDLRTLFLGNGFGLIESGVNRLPAAINSDLAQAITDGRRDDSHLWIAYKGPKAQEYLQPSN
jgi:hypothetical protein